jgi:hypothetical protein
VTRNIVIGLVVVVLAVLTGIWLARNTHWEDVEVHTPMKGEAATNPFYALQHLSEALGAHTQVRHEIVNLPSSRGVIVVNFWNWNIIPERRKRLEQWVSDGGRLLVGSNEVSEQAFVEWSGVKEMPAPGRDQEAPRRTLPKSNSLTCGSLTRRLTSATDSKEHYSPCGYELAHGLLTTRKVTWRLLDRDGHTQAVRIPIGRGSVTVLNEVSPGNLGVLCGEYGLLFAAATQLHRGDQVTFLTEGGGGSLLGLIWQYGAPVVVLAAVLIALWLWRSGVRFGPLAAATESARRSLAEQIRGTGQFTLRFGGGAALHAACVRALNEVASRNIVHYERLDADARVAALAKLTRLQPADLTRALYDDKDRVKPQEIRRTIAFLEAARRRLLAATQQTYRNN